MQKVNVVLMVLLTLVTFGIYAIFWHAKRRGEMVRAGADVPTTWLVIIPLVNLYYYYKFSMGSEKVTDGKLNGLLMFVLYLVFSYIAMILIQLEFNKLAESGGPAMQGATAGPQPVAPADASGVPAPEVASASSDASSSSMSEQPADSQSPSVASESAVVAPSEPQVASAQPAESEPSGLAQPSASAGMPSSEESATTQAPEQPVVPSPSVEESQAGVMPSDSDNSDPMNPPTQPVA